MNVIQKASKDWKDAFLQFCKQHPGDLYIPLDYAGNGKRYRMGKKGE